MHAKANLRIQNMVQNVQHDARMLRPVATLGPFNVGGGEAEIGFLPLHSALPRVRPRVVFDPATKDHVHRSQGIRYAVRPKFPTAVDILHIHNVPRFRLFLLRDELGSGARDVVLGKRKSTQQEEVQRLNRKQGGE